MQLRRLLLTTIGFAVTLGWCGFLDDAASPAWTTVPVRRSVDARRLGTVLADVDSRLPATGLTSSATYRSADRITWTHEATHGVNSLVRNTRAPAPVGYNAAYVLNGRAAVIKEPQAVTLGNVAASVPRQLRGSTFQLYLVDQRRYWDRQPLYMLDEWAAYTNGADQLVRDLRRGVRHNDTSSLTHMCHFAVYSLCMAYAADMHNSNRQYDDRQLKLFIAWQWNRMMNILADAPAGAAADAVAYYRKFATAPAGRQLRDWAKQYFGDEWAVAVMRLGV